jgi:hypothetical protein
VAKGDVFFNQAEGRVGLRGAFAKLQFAGVNVLDGPFDRHTLRMLHRSFSQRWIPCERLEAGLGTCLIGKAEKLLRHIELWAGIGLSAKDGRTKDVQAGK